eukprot:TRINITY_DN10861_c0_g1_i2.p1 TRINITY_DN10861_c0_g1~~TRINITY_DN10861_c0_g1_i2.p1  ORF type:complete len:1040 (-),score=136.86 TRINITY_DN10861_c0_g1_i2:505-3270(-)
MVASKVPSVCKVIKSSIPYEMPGAFPLPSVLGKFGVSEFPVSWIPYVGSQLPEKGTDLRFIHELCTTAEAIIGHNVTRSAVHELERQCQKAASFLLRHAPAGTGTVLHDLDSMRLKKTIKDASQLRGSLSLHIYNSDPFFQAKGYTIPTRMSFKKNRNAEKLDGTLVKIAGNLGGCGMYPENATEIFIKVKAILVVTCSNTCKVSQVISKAEKAGAAGVILTGCEVDDWELKRELDQLGRDGNKDYPVAVLSSKLDGLLLTSFLDDTNPIGPEAQADDLTTPWEEQHSRTSHGCKCKGMGYDSDCKLRPANLTGDRNLDKGAPPFHWCETAELDMWGQPCAAQVDLCVPPGELQVVEKPNEMCIDDCHRVFRGKDTCMFEASFWNPKHMECVPPQGLSGNLTVAGDAEGIPVVQEIEGTAVDFRHRPFSRLELGGFILVPKSESCFVRLTVSPGAKVKRYAIGDYVGLLAGKEEELDSYSEELKIHIEVSGVNSTAVLEQACSKHHVTTWKETDWEVVPMEQLRYPYRYEPKKGPDLKKAVTSIPRVGTLGSISRRLQDQAGVHKSEGNNNRSETEAPTTCRQTLSRACSMGDGAKYVRCGENQVCDSFGVVKEGTRYCRCAVDHCWSAKKEACVPLPIHAQEVIGNLIDDMLLHHHVPLVWETTKFLATGALALQEGVSNLFSIMNCVLAIAPGLMISAWTAKLIFINSSIPAFFIYMFPWLYSPVAWSLYGIAHEIAADWLLTIGLGWLAFWPIFVGFACARYKYHLEMSVPQAMSITNDLLLFYYLHLAIAYGLCIAFLVFFEPQGEDYISRGIRMNLDLKALIQWHLAKGQLSDLFLGLATSFGTYFATCIAATDVFCVVVVFEAERAWRLDPRGTLPSNRGGVGTSGSVSCEREVVTCAQCLTSAAGIDFAVCIVV